MFAQYNFMEILIYLILLMSVLVLLFLLFILINHWLRWRSAYVLESKKAAWEDVLYSYLAGELSAGSAVARFKGNYLYLWEFLKPYLTYLKGTERDQIIALAREAGLTDYFVKKLKQGKKREKIRAASALGKLGERQVVTHLKDRLFSRDPIEMIFAAKAIADMKETSYLVPVFRKLLNDTYTTYEGISEIAVRFGEDICPPIKNMIQEWLDGERDLAATFQVTEAQGLSLLVDILGYYRYLAAAPQLEKTLQQTIDNEVIIHIFKALTRMAYPVSITLTPFLFHQDWIIRSQAVKYIGKLQDTSYRETMKALLEDENWWVRYYAARALYLMDEIAYLKQISALKDQKAEMSQYMLNKYQVS